MAEFLDFATRNWTLFAVLAGVVAMLVVTEVMRLMRAGHTVDAQDALRLFNEEDAVLVDVREVGEYRDGHVPGATSIPVATLKSRPEELEKFKNRPIILYCRTGGQSGSAASLLKKNGYSRVYNLKGGIGTWSGANLPIVKGRK